MDNYTLFESYLSRKLSEQDRLNFETKRKGDSALEAAFQEHLVTQASLDHLLEEDIKEVIKNIQVEQAAKKEGNKFKWLIIAVAAALAIGLIFFNQLNVNSNNTNAQLVAEYYKAPMATVTRGGNDTEESKTIISITKAHTAFQAKDYLTAAAKFEEVMQSAAAADKERAEWYLALSILNTDPQKAKTILTRIADNPQHKKYPEAVKLLADSRF